jgi:hypothetical protein
MRNLKEFAAGYWQAGAMMLGATAAALVAEQVPGLVCVEGGLLVLATLMVATKGWLELRDKISR